MPITPLHFGLMAPFTYWFRRHGIKPWVALVAFALGNLYIDLPAIGAWAAGQPLPSHDDSAHSFVGAATIGLFLALPGALPGIRSVAWVAGSFFGTFSHVFLDALVHPEMQPFRFMWEGNSLYMGWMQPVSLALLPLTIWLIAQIVSYSLVSARRLREAWRRRHDQRSS